MSHRHASVFPVELTEIDSSVPLERESGVELATPRAKVMARPERHVAARVFSMACDASGLSNVTVARWLGVSETRVREMRSGQKPVTLETLLRVPPSVAHVAGLGLIEHAKGRSLVVVR